MATTLLPPSDVTKKYWERVQQFEETPFFACEADPRIAYCMYVPPEHHGLNRKMPLVVTVHGSFRKAQTCRDNMVDLAKRSGVSILAPLIPAGLEGPNICTGTDCCVAARTNQPLGMTENCCIFWMRQLLAGLGSTPPNSSFATSLDADNLR